MLTRAAGRLARALTVACFGGPPITWPLCGGWHTNAKVVACHNAYHQSYAGREAATPESDVTIFELVKVALDELYAEGSAEYGKDLDAKIQDRIGYLSTSYTGKLEARDRS